MKILVVGASQGTGAACVRTALERGHTVTAFARSPQKLTIDDARLRKVAGDIHNAADVDAAVAGQDAVITTIGVSSLSLFKKDPTYVSKGTDRVIAAMRKHGVKRLAVLSAMGVGDSRKAQSFFVNLLLVDGLLKLPFQDHEREDKSVRQSGLEWVLARPTRLTDGPAKKQYVAKTAVEKVPSSISRADVADFLVAACEKPDWVGHAVHLGG